jgi:hypothetical protein
MWLMDVKYHIFLHAFEARMDLRIWRFLTYPCLVQQLKANKAQ